MNSPHTDVLIAKPDSFRAVSNIERNFILKFFSRIQLLDIVGFFLDFRKDSKRLEKIRKDSQIELVLPLTLTAIEHSFIKKIFLTLYISQYTMG